MHAQARGEQGDGERQRDGEERVAEHGGKLPQPWYDQYTTKHGEKATIRKHKTPMQLESGKGPRNQRDVLTPDQLRAARALLDWSRADLSDASSIPVRTIENFETGKVTPLLTTAGKLRRALEKAGVIFVDPTTDHGPGVILKDGKLR